jgi:hypothetical protein
MAFTSKTPGSLHGRDTMSDLAQNAARPGCGERVHGTVTGRRSRRVDQREHGAGGWLSGRRQQARSWAGAAAKIPQSLYTAGSQSVANIARIAKSRADDR